MRKLFILVVAVCCFVACGDDDNVWPGSSGGGNQPVHASKLISQILVSGDTAYEEPVPILFSYDKDNRLVKIYAEMLRQDKDGVKEYTTTVNINHGKSTAVCEIIKTRDGVEFTDKSRKVIVLDDYGRATSGDYVDYQYDLAGVYTNTQAQFELEYDRSGRLYRSSMNYLGEGGNRENLENQLVWKGSNLMEVKRNNSGKELSDKAYYSDVLNKSNIDLNWLCYAHNAGFSIIAGDPDNLFVLLGYCGKRSRNMPEMIVGQEAANNHRCFFTYNLDDEDYVTEVRVEKGNDLITYKIQYKQ